MSSTTVIGYTHSDGYCLCVEHADDGEMDDDGNESGKVQPIFEGAEWDSVPTCDVCHEEIEGVTLLNACIGNHEENGYPCKVCGESSCPECDTYYLVMDNSTGEYISDANLIIKVDGTLEGNVAHRTCVDRSLEIC